MWVWMWWVSFENRGSRERRPLRWIKLSRVVGDDDDDDDGGLARLPSNQHRRSGQLKKSARRLQALGKHYVFRSLWQRREMSGLRIGKKDYGPDALQL